MSSAAVVGKLLPMKTHLAPTACARSGAPLTDSTFWSTVDGYLAASASGPNFPMPDQVLRSLSAAGHCIGPRMASRITGHFAVVNNALNDQVYQPELGSVKAWCQGYLAGFGEEMVAWAPMLAAQPELMADILAGADGRRLLAGDPLQLGDIARRIHGFWSERRRNGVGATDLLAALNAMLSCVSLRRTNYTDGVGRRFI